MVVSRVVVLGVAIGLLAAAVSEQPTAAERWPLAMFAGSDATHDSVRAGLEPTAAPLMVSQTQAGPGNVQRGRYIVESVAMCGECHSTRDAQGNIAEGTRYMGGPMPVTPPWPNDWAVRTPRIAGLLGYTNELGIRLLTQGAIGRDGTQLRPPMPRFRMTPEDAAAVVAYLKSLS